MNVAGWLVVFPVSTTEQISEDNKLATGQLQPQNLSRSCVFVTSDTRIFRRSITKNNFRIPSQMWMVLLESQGPVLLLTRNEITEVVSTQTSKLLTTEINAVVIQVLLST